MLLPSEEISIVSHHCVRQHYSAHLLRLQLVELHCSVCVLLVRLLIVRANDYTGGLPGDFLAGLGIDGVGAVGYCRCGVVTCGVGC